MLPWTELPHHVPFSCKQTVFYHLFNSHGGKVQIGNPLPSPPDVMPTWKSLKYSFFFSSFNVFWFTQENGDREKFFFFRLRSSGNKMEFWFSFRCKVMLVPRAYTQVNKISITSVVWSRHATGTGERARCVMRPNKGSEGDYNKRGTNAVYFCVIIFRQHWQMEGLFTLYQAVLLMETSQFSARFLLQNWENQLIKVTHLNPSIRKK